MLALFLVASAFAGRVERVADLQKSGADAEVVETVDKWEKGGGLGDDAAALQALRDRSALNLALAAHTVEALAAYRRTWPHSTLLQEALAAEWDLAFAAAQEEGTSAALRAYVAAYPTSPLQAQAVSLEAGLAFQEAAALGTPAAIAAFTTSHPDSPYAATAWEALAARAPGIYVRLADGLPKKLEAVPVTDGRITFPSALVTTPARPTVAVNLPGTGRGETSEWWGLFALAEDGTLGTESALGSRLRAAVGAAAAPPRLLALSALPGAHSARVAAPAAPLVAPGVCEGLARFAFVLTTTEGAKTAFPFAVPCTESPPDDSAVPLLLAAFGIAEDGDGAQALRLWDQAVKLADGPDLLAWMATAVSDPRDALVVRRAGLTDVLVWDGTATTWWHPTDAGPVPLARREGLWIADGAHLWRWTVTPEPWTAPAGGGCAAATGERPHATLVDTRGDARVDLPLLDAPRGGTLTPRQYAAGVLAVVEESANTGCPHPGAPLPRTVRLPGDATGSYATALAPDWAAPLVQSAPGHSVVTAAPWALWQLFQAGPPAPELPAEPVLPGAPVEAAGDGAPSPPPVAPPAP